MLQLSVNKYLIGWICGHPSEFVVAKAMLDEQYKPAWGQNSNDPNMYTTGRIRNHNVVIACLPIRTDSTGAAVIATAHLVHTFPSIRFVLMVGIGSGIPNLQKGVDIRLGDVVVSHPRNTRTGIVQHDIRTLYEGLWRDYDDQHDQHNQQAAGPYAVLRNLRAAHQTTDNRGLAFLSRTSDIFPEGREDAHSFPDLEADVLRCSHDAEKGTSCELCEHGEIVRNPRMSTKPIIHYGLVVSVDNVITSAVHRDQLASQYEGALCIENEAAGLTHGFPGLVIRGICDYADSSRSDLWRKYAATTAAAFTKDLLWHVPRTEFISRQPIQGPGTLRRSLSHAAASGNVEIVELLLATHSSWLDLNEPLTEAARNGREKLAKVLLGHPALGRYSNLDRPLAAAASNGHRDIVKLLLASPVGYSQLTDALSEALRNKHGEIVELLEAYPRLNAGTTLGNSLLGTARSRYTGIGERLLTDPNFSDEVPLLRRPFKAASQGRREFAELRLSRLSTDVPLRGSLSEAARCGHGDKVALTSARPDVNVNDGKALCRAAYKGHEEIVKYLLAQSGINVNFGGPLCRAAANGHKEVVKLLLARSDIDVNLGRPLLEAATNGHKDIVQLLLAHPDIRVDLGEPLTNAVAGGHKDIVQLLLAHPDIRVNLGEPLTNAVAGGHREVAKLLRAHPDIDTSIGESASSLAHNRQKMLSEQSLSMIDDVDVEGNTIVEEDDEEVFWGESSIGKNEYPSSGPPKGEMNQKQQQQGTGPFVKQERDKQKRVPQFADVDAMRRHLEKSSSTNILSLIEELSEELPVHIHNYKIEVLTELGSFIEKEMDESHDLLSMLTLTGTNQCCFAANCSEYVEKYWPNQDALHLLQQLWLCLLAMRTEVIDHRSFAAKAGFSEKAMEVDVDINPQSHKTLLNFKIRDISRDNLIQLSHLLSWLCAQFRVSTRPGCFYSDAKLSSESLSLKIDLRPLEAIPSSEHLCWNDMIGNAIIARRFPVPERHGGVGLELPFDVMMSLSGALYPFMYRNCIVLKGYSTVLVPVAQSAENALQWHFNRAKVAQHSVLTERVGSQVDKAMLPTSIDELIDSNQEIFDIASLGPPDQVRCFLGMWQDIEVLLGTRCSSYNEFQVSEEDLETGSCVIDKEISIAAGISKMITLMGAGKVKIISRLSVQDNGAHFSFEDLLKRSARHPLVLYDTTAQNAWMVPELSFVLHLAILELKSDPKSSKQKLPYAVPSASGGEAAFLAISNSQQDHPDLERIVRRIFTAFMERRDVVIKRNAETTIFHPTSLLLGWEIDDLRCAKYLCNRRKTPLDMSATGGWQQIINDRPDILVLFSKDLVSSSGYPFQPSLLEASCSWSTFPLSRCLMLTPTRCLDCIKQPRLKSMDEFTYRVTKDRYLVGTHRLCPCKVFECDRILFQLSNKGSAKALNLPNGAISIGDPTCLAISKRLPSNKLKSCDTVMQSVVCCSHEQHVHDHHQDSLDEVSAGSNSDETMPSYLADQQLRLSQHATPAGLEDPSYSNSNGNGLTVERRITRKPAFVDLPTQLRQWPKNGVFYNLPNKHITVEEGSGDYCDSQPAK